MPLPDFFQLVADLVHGGGVLLLIRLTVLRQAESVSLKSQELYLLVFLNRYVEHIALDNSYLDIGKICFIFFTSLLVVLMRCSPPSYGYTSQDFVQHWKFLFVPMVGMAWVCSGSGFGFLAILKFIVFVGVVGFYWMVTTDGIHINVPQIESIRVFYAEKRTALLVAVLFFFSIVVFLQDSMYGLSLLLESVAMVPQLAMLYSNGERDETGMFEWFPDGLIQVPLPIFMVSIYRYIYILHFIYRNATEDSYHFQPLIHLTTLLQSVINAPIIYLFCKQQMEQRNGENRIALNQGADSGYSLLTLDHSIGNAPTDQQGLTVMES